MGIFNFSRNNRHSPHWDFEGERTRILREMERHPLQPRNPHSLRQHAEWWVRLERIRVKKWLEETNSQSSWEFQLAYLDYMEALCALKHRLIPLSEFKQVSQRFQVVQQKEHDEREQAIAARKQQVQYQPRHETHYESHHEPREPYQQSELQSQQSSSRQRHQCAYCGGAGFYSCQRCLGTGSVADELRPHYTGNQVADGLIRAAFELKSICPKCRGSAEFTCHRCSGTGYTP